MENHNNVDVSISVVAAGASRWNPTKEQTDMLESLYRQGIRKPNAEQIQQITNKLRDFGHIEGRNVFSIESRTIRQGKAKAEAKARPCFLFQSLSPQNLCSSTLFQCPFYMSYPEMRLCQQQQQQPKVLVPKGFKRRRTLPEKLEKIKLCGRAIHDQANWEYNHIAVMHPCKANEDCVMSPSKHCDQETLDLFPLHPTRNLQSRTETASFSLRSTSIANPTTIPPTSSASKLITDQEASRTSLF